MSKIIHNRAMFSQTNSRSSMYVSDKSTVALKIVGWSGSKSSNQFSSLFQELSQHGKIRDFCHFPHIESTHVCLEIQSHLTTLESLLNKVRSSLPKCVISTISPAQLTRSLSELSSQPSNTSLTVSGENQLDEGALCRELANHGDIRSLVYTRPSLCGWICQVSFYEAYSVEELLVTPLKGYRLQRRGARDPQDSSLPSSSSEEASTAQSCLREKAFSCRASEQTPSGGCLPERTLFSSASLYVENALSIARSQLNEQASPRRVFKGRQKRSKSVGVQTQNSIIVTLEKNTKNNFCRTKRVPISELLFLSIGSKQTVKEQILLAQESLRAGVSKKPLMTDSQSYLSADDLSDGFTAVESPEDFDLDIPSQSEETLTKLTPIEILTRPSSTSGGSQENLIGSMHQFCFFSRR